MTVTDNSGSSQLRDHVLKEKSGGEGFWVRDSGGPFRFRPPFSVKPREGLGPVKQRVDTHHDLAHAA